MKGGEDVKTYIPYIAAAILGLFARSLISAANGWIYAINGVDLLVSVAAIGLVWSFKGLFLEPNPKKRK